MFFQKVIKPDRSRKKIMVHHPLEAQKRKQAAIYPRSPYSFTEDKNIVSLEIILEIFDEAKQFTATSTIVKIV